MLPARLPVRLSTRFPLETTSLDQGCHTDGDFAPRLLISLRSSIARKPDDAAGAARGTCDGPLPFGVSSPPIDRKEQATATSMADIRRKFDSIEGIARSYLEELYGALELMEGAGGCDDTKEIDVRIFALRAVMQNVARSIEEQHFHIKRLEAELESMVQEG